MNKKIVLCDDDKTTTMILKHLLTPLGFSVAIAHQGKEGLALIEAERPDLLILDLDMPVKNGVSVLEDLRAKGITGFYIIILSSREDDQAHVQVKELGAQEVIVKPFKPSALIKHVEELLKEGKLECKKA